MDSFSSAEAQEKRKEALDRANAEYNRVMEETTRYLKALFYIWLALMLYVAVDSRGEHVVGFLVFSGLVMAAVGLGVRCVEWCEDQF